MNHSSRFVVRAAALVAALVSPIVTVSTAVAEDVRLLRDPWGVPHVYATTNRGAGYGHGWAVAEDRMLEALNAMWTAQGRRTEIEGEKAVQIDRTFRLLRIAEFLEAHWDEYPPLVRDLAEGYAEGFNAYMAAHPDEVPAWATPIEPVWTLAVGRLVNFWPSLGNVNGERRGLAKPLSVLDFGMSDEHWRAVGSNGFAIAAERSGTGAAMIAADPHMPWKHEFRLYETHLVSDEIDFAGAGFIGSALPVFGRTPDVAWTWTANNPDHGDVYRLELDPENAERYRFGDGWREFERRDVTYRLPDGGEVVETIRWSVHGPVTWHDPAEHLAVAYWMSAYGLWEPPLQFIEMVQSRNLDDLERAMARMQFASFNIVAADSSGDVLFVCGGRVPRRPEGLDAERPLDGSDPALVWDEIVPWSELPAVRRPACGFVQNCNNDPQFTTGTDADPAAATFPLGTGGGRGDGHDTIRAWYLRQRLNEVAQIDPELARAILCDGTMIPHRVMRDRLQVAWERFGETYPDRRRIERDVRGLIEWDGVPRSMASEPTLFLLWLYLYGGEKAMLGVDFMTRPSDDLDETDATRLFDTLRDARIRIGKLLPFGSDLPWGLAHVIRKNGRPYSVETGMYPAISLMNANADLRGSDISKIQCTIGSAYVALHEMSDPPRSWSVTPIGQTDRADRPYAENVTQLFARRELKPLPLTLEQLAEVGAVETVLVLDEGAE